MMENDKKISVYEQQAKNIEELYKNNPDNWFYKSQMELPESERVGFAPKDGICWNCRKDILSDYEYSNGRVSKGITLESLGNYIIIGCPHCNRSYCD